MSLSTSSSSNGNGRRTIYMSVPRIIADPETSFEEARMNAYIQAYQTTGRAPEPTPPEPLDPAERARLGLLPLFEPYSEYGGVAAPLDARTLRSLQAQRNGSPPRTADLTAVPEVQVFVPSTLPTGSEQDNSLQQFQSIVVQDQYTPFSFEELRYRAYWIGKRYVPEAAAANFDTSDQFQAITCRPEYSQHSFEELRLAHIRTNYELTSDQIKQHAIL